jgi:hypothetical protein
VKKKMSDVAKAGLKRKREEGIDNVLETGDSGAMDNTQQNKRKRKRKKSTVQTSDQFTTQLSSQQTGL